MLFVCSLRGTWTSHYVAGADASEEEGSPSGCVLWSGSTVGYFRVRKTIGGHSAKLGKKSQDAYLVVFRKVDLLQIDNHAGF